MFPSGLDAIEPIVAPATWITNCGRQPRMKVDGSATSPEGNSQK